MTATVLAQPRAEVSRSRLGIGLLAFIWVLPFHTVLMAWLFGGLGMPARLVRVVAAWKEALVAALVVAVAFRLALGRSRRSPVYALDLPVAGLIFLGLAYLLGGYAWFGLDVPIGARLYGLRDLVFFSLLYFVGRTTPDVVRDHRVLKALFLVGVITSFVAALERLFVTPQMLVLLGTADYFRDFLGGTVWTAGNPYGLPANYWTMIGGQLVQRAGSTYLTSQGFAIPFLVIMPAATVWLLARKRTPFAWLSYALLWAGLLLTVTRMTIVACLLQALIIAGTRRRWGIIASTVAACAVAFSSALLMFPSLANFIGETLTWQSASSLAHVDDWVTGLENTLRYPLGAGLGVADQAAARSGLVALAADNQYLTYAVQLGVFGLTLHLLTIAGAALIGFKCARAAPDVRSDYGIVVATTALGILINAVTAGVFNAILLSSVFFWLVGSLVTAASIEDTAAA